MNNEPVAWMLVTGHGTKILEKKPYCEVDYWKPLYTHPVKELNDGGEQVKNATYWKRQYNLMATQNDNLKSGLYHANEQIKYLESHPVKELTDEDIWEFIPMSRNDSFVEAGAGDFIWFARAILRKASGK